MSTKADVKVRCTECEGRCFVRVSRNPNIDDKACPTCEGIGYLQMSRADLLKRNLERKEYSEWVAKKRAQGADV